MGNRLTSHRGVNDGLTAIEDSVDPFPPPRLNSLPPLESREAQSEFLTSPTAVVASLGLRIPAALSQHIRRRSSLPPAPPGDEVSGIQRVADIIPEIPPPPKVPADAVALVAAEEPPPAAAAETKRARPKAGRRKKN
jgi:hypothetical protein